MERILEKLEKLKKIASPERKGASAKSKLNKNQENVMDTSLTDHRHRMTEQEEDEELMINDKDIDDEAEVITRFESSPWCKYNDLHWVLYSN
jgi:hypothetical protein